MYHHYIIGFIEDDNLCEKIKLPKTANEWSSRGREFLDEVFEKYLAITEPVKLTKDEVSAHISEHGQNLVYFGGTRFLAVPKNSNGTRMDFLISSTSQFLY